jgi:hypothetical protein
MPLIEDIMWVSEGEELKINLRPENYIIQYYGAFSSNVVYRSYAMKFSFEDYA